jgi:hypothetical protein
MRHVRERSADLENELSDARLVNDAASPQIKGLEEFLRVREDRLKWMRGQVAIWLAQPRRARRIVPLPRATFVRR